jgi:hypothetical protein
MATTQTRISKSGMECTHGGTDGFVRIHLGNLLDVLLESSMAFSKSTSASQNFRNPYCFYPHHVVYSLRTTELFTLCSLSRLGYGYDTLQNQYRWLLSPPTKQQGVRCRPIGFTGVDISIRRPNRLLIYPKHLYPRPRRAISWRPFPLLSRLLDETLRTADLVL